MRGASTTRSTRCLGSRDSSEHGRDYRADKDVGKLHPRTFGRPQNAAVADAGSYRPAEPKLAHVRSLNPCSLHEDLISKERAARQQIEDLGHVSLWFTRRPLLDLLGWNMYEVRRFGKWLSQRNGRVLRSSSRRRPTKEAGTMRPSANGHRAEHFKHSDAFREWENVGEA